MLRFLSVIQYHYHRICIGHHHVLYYEFTGNSQGETLVKSDSEYFAISVCLCETQLITFCPLASTMRLR